MSDELQDSTSPDGSSNNPCPANAVYTTQTVGREVNTLTCHDEDWNIIGTPIFNEPTLPDVCRSDPRVDHYFTDINTGYIECNAARMPLYTTNYKPYKHCPDKSIIRYDENWNHIGCPVILGSDNSVMDRFKSIEEANRFYKYIRCPFGFEYANIDNETKCIRDPISKDWELGDWMCNNIGDVLINNNGSYSCGKDSDYESGTEGSSNNSCPENTVVSKQTLREYANTLSCYDVNSDIIGTPRLNEPTLPDVCKSDSRVDNYLTRIDTGYIQCNTGDVPLVTSNTCPNGYKTAITPELELNGKLSYGCMFDPSTYDNQEFTCPFNVIPMQTEDPIYGTLYKCTLPSSSAQFTNVNGFKSRKGRRVENFSQNTNGKCKARY
jgi:hypothetical protein